MAEIKKQMFAREKNGTNVCEKKKKNTYRKKCVWWIGPGKKERARGKCSDMREKMPAIHNCKRTKWERTRVAREKERTNGWIKWKKKRTRKYREKIYSNKNRTLPHYRMDSFQLFLIKTLVGMSNRGVVGMLCTMDMHRLYIRSNNTNSQCKYDARTNFYIIFFSVPLSADFLSTEKLRESEKNVQHTHAFVLIKERGVKDTCIFIFLPNNFFFHFFLFFSLFLFLSRTHSLYALKLKRIFFGNII